jgi:hypothetical protein
MKNSGYARLIYSAGSLEIYCTDEEMIRSACEEITSLFPASKIRWKRQLISGEDYYCYIEKLPGDKDGAVAFWALKQFCLKGWEPFEAKEGIFSVNTHSTILLRLTTG